MRTPSDRASERHAPRLPASPTVLLIVASLIFLVLSFLLFGVRVVDDYSRSYIGGNGPDPKLFIWSMRWWSGPAFGPRNPFHADVIWAPIGYDLTWATTVPGPAAIIAPLTRVAGPIASFNTLMLVGPVLAAAATFALCMAATKRFWASVVGGCVFGFSSYMLAHIRGGHLNLLLVFPVPLIALTVFVAVTRGMSRRRLVLSLTALFTGLLAISSELFATTTGMTALALALAFATADPTMGESIKRVVPNVLFAYGLTLVAVMPFLVVAFVGNVPVQVIDVSAGSTDLLNLIVPTSITWFRPWGTHDIANEFAGAVSGHGAYVGIPLLVAGAMAAWHQRRRFAGRFLALFAVTTFLISLGPSLRMGGNSTGVPLPGALLGLVPVIEKAHPGRLFMFTTLAVSVLVAVFLSSTTSNAWRWGLVVVGLGLLLPAPRDWIWKTTPDTPAFFTERVYESQLDPAENVLVLSRTSALALVWQAEARMKFSMPVAYTGGVPSASHPAAGEQFLYRQQCPSKPLPSSFWHTLRGWGVHRVVVPNAGRESEGCPIPVIGDASSTSIGDVLIYAPRTESDSP